MTDDKNITYELTYYKNGIQSKEISGRSDLDDMEYAKKLVVLTVSFKNGDAMQSLDFYLPGIYLSDLLQTWYMFSRTSWPEEVFWLSLGKADGRNVKRIYRVCSIGANMPVETENGYHAIRFGDRTYIVTLKKS